MRDLKAGREETAMYVFAVLGKVQPGKADEFAQRWKDFYGTRLKEVPGFERSYCAADRAADSTLVMSVWSAKPDEAQLRQVMQEFSGVIADVTAGPPDTHWYELLQHI
jgi:hypothetical protein